jgi:hypothetical protein
VEKLLSAISARFVEVIRLLSSAMGSALPARTANIQIEYRYVVVTAYTDKNVNSNDVDKAAAI